MEDPVAGVDLLFVGVYLAAEKASCYGVVGISAELNSPGVTGAFFIILDRHQDTAGIRAVVGADGFDETGHGVFGVRGRVLTTGVFSPSWAGFSMLPGGDSGRLFG